jgi:hypothetical protein
MKTCVTYSSTEKATRTWFSRSLTQPFCAKMCTCKPPKLTVDKTKLCEWAVHQAAPKHCIRITLVSKRPTWFVTERHSNLYALIVRRA